MKRGIARFLIVVSALFIILFAISITYYKNNPPIILTKSGTITDRDAITYPSSRLLSYEIVNKGFFNVYIKELNFNCKDVEVKNIKIYDYTKKSNDKFVELPKNFKLKRKKETEIQLSANVRNKTAEISSIEITYKILGFEFKERIDITLFSK